MYYRHFGLSGAPFASTASPSLLFLSKTHREARAALDWSFQNEPGGLSLLTGERGTGKTAVILSLLAEQRTPIRIAYISHPISGFDGLLDEITQQLGTGVRSDSYAASEAANRHSDKHAPGERAVAIVDDAHTLSDATLEQLQVYSNRNRLVHFVLAGEPSLMTRVSECASRPITERINVSTMLQPLDTKEALAYVNYRLAAVGGSAGALFAQGALEYLLKRSGGIPRKINVFCHNALIRAYGAGEFRVSIKSARDAAFEVEELFAGQHRPASILALPKFMQRHLRALFSASYGLAPAIMAATWAILGIGLLHFWNSKAFYRTPNFDYGTSETIGDQETIVYPQMKAPLKASFSRERSPTNTGFASSRTETQDRAEPRQVRVRPGDTLLTIARAYLGSGEDVDQLIRDINHIYPGEILTLPAEGSQAGGVREKVASEWQLTSPDTSIITNEEQ